MLSFSEEVRDHDNLVDMADEAAIRAAVRSNTKVVYTESLSNPTLRVANLPLLAKLSQEFEAKLVVDNTFTPLAMSPIEHGADVVVHSLTKRFINGASDFIAGAVCGSEAFIGSLMDLHVGPFDPWSNDGSPGGSFN